MSIVQINPFRLSPNHSVTDSLSIRFTVNIFSRSALAGEGPQQIFHRDPNLHSAGLGTRIRVYRIFQMKYAERIKRHYSIYKGALFYLTNVARLTSKTQLITAISHVAHRRSHLWVICSRYEHLCDYKKIKAFFFSNTVQYPRTAASSFTRSESVRF